MTIEAFAPAKINLTLHVTGQRPDGYHLLDSLVVFADLGDRLWLEAGPALSLEVTGEFAAGVPTDARNLVWRAAELAGWTGHIRLEKNLPHGAGIGGGSSDAAALLRALGASVDAVALGADVPVCVLSRAARMQGIGEALTPVDLAPLHAVLVNPGVHVATPAVFKALERKDNAPMADMPNGDVLEWLRAQRNDLETPALHCAPELARVRTALEAFDTAQLVRMSGSGATFFALMPARADADAAVRALQAAHPDWWCRACRLG